MHLKSMIYNFGLGMSASGLIISLIGFASDITSLWNAGLVMLSVGLAIGINRWENLRSYSFTVWIMAGFVAAMIYSKDLIIWGGFNITHKWIVFLVIQATMFSMGTKITLRDFIDVMKMPWGVFVGTFCHFLIMPLLGFSLTLIFSFPPEVAVGIILIGSCSSGLSSTVMIYISKANLALGISVTAVSTLVATLMTPLWVKILAGSLIEIQLMSMIMDVIKIVLIPIGAAMLHDYLKTYASHTGKRVVHLLMYISIVWLVYMIAGGWGSLIEPMSADNQMMMVVVNFVAGGIIWSVFYNWIHRKFSSVEKIMPTISMLGIIFFTTTAAAAGRDNLMQVGVALCFATLLHNIGGYSIGYAMSRWVFRLDEESSRTIAFEVGLQNGGMASGLAAAMGKLATVGLAAAIMTPLGNITGSLLANYWRRKEIKPVPSATPAVAAQPTTTTPQP
ncbi:MAG: bile acid:sodium symporter family protein [Limnobaculum xujianqingii]